MASSSIDQQLIGFGSESAVPTGGAAKSPDLDAALVGFGPAYAAAPAQAPEPIYKAQPWYQNMLVGGLQGAAAVGHTVGNLLDPAAQFLENRFGTLGGPSVAQARAARDLENQQYQTQYGNSPAALVGNIIGSTALTAPLIAGGAEAVGANPLVAAAMTKLRNAGLAGRMLAGGASGAAQGAAAAGITSGGYDQPIADQIRSGAVFGGALGAAAPAVQGAAASTYRALTGSGGVNPLVLNLAKSAVNDYGIPIRGSQITQSPFVRFLDSVVRRTPLSGMSKSTDDIANSFNKAVSNTIGVDSENLTPDVVQAAKKAIGSKFEQVAANTTIRADGSLLNDLSQVANDARMVLPESEVSPINHQIENILSKVKDGTISGETYQALTRNGTPLDRAMDSANPNIAHYASQIRGALDDALQRSAPQDMQDLLAKAKYQWKNYITLKPLIEKAGAEGHISPPLLLNRVRQVWGNVDTGGGGDLGNLARIGQQFLKEAPTSGTSERLSIGALLGELGAGAVHPPLLVPLLGGTAASLGAARGIGSALQSNWYRNMLLNAANQAGPSAASPILQDIAIPTAISAQKALTLQALPSPLIINAQ